MDREELATKIGFLTEFNKTQLEINEGFRDRLEFIEESIKTFISKNE